MARLLVIEDDPAVARRLVRGLKRAGFEVEFQADGAAGLALADDPKFDLIVLDLMLPSVSGFDILGWLRERSRTPVVVVSASRDLESRLKSFGLGAVDFVEKPFWMEELVARIRTRLRIEEERPREEVRWGDAVCDLDARVVWVAGEDAGLTPAEFSVLALLVRRPGRAVSREELAQAVGGGDSEALGRTVDSHVARLRRKLAGGGAAIRTVRSIGYRFEPGDASDGVAAGGPEA